MLIDFVDATNDANHYTKPPPKYNECEEIWNHENAIIIDVT